MRFKHGQHYEYTREACRDCWTNSPKETDKRTCSIAVDSEKEGGL
jgi:hypothetical protein